MSHREFPTPAELAAAIGAIGPLDAAAMAAAQERLDLLTKPPGSLGRLESLAIQLAGITGEPAPRFAKRAIVVAAADHGIAARGVSAYPSDVTAQMVANFVHGGAAINVLARLAGAEVVVVDAGVAGSAGWLAEARLDGTGSRLLSRPVRAGTADLSAGPAMSRAEALQAVHLGLEIASDLVSQGVSLLGIGEMGIGNTTAASAVVAALTGRAARDVTGRGTGIDEATWSRKVGLIERGLDVNDPDPADPIGVLAAVGGLEIATLVGVILGAAALAIPVVIDGFITGASALIAARLCPAVAPRLIAAHRSVEPGHHIVLEALGLRPLLDLELRLGEGTGAALAMGLIDAACRVRDEMATFESAGVSGRSD